MQFMFKYTRVIRRQSKWLLSNNSKKVEASNLSAGNQEKFLAGEWIDLLLTESLPGWRCLSKNKQTKHEVTVQDHVLRAWKSTEKCTQCAKCEHIRAFVQGKLGSPWHSVWKLHTRADVDFHKVSCGFAGSHHPDLRKINVLYGPAKYTYFLAKKEHITAMLQAEGIPSGNAWPGESMFGNCSDTGVMQLENQVFQMTYQQ